MSLSLDYDGEDWAQLKKLYARLARDGALRELIGDEVPWPPTLDGALNLGATFAGLSFEEDIRPLLGGRLLIGVRVTAAAALAPEVRDILERLDPDATKFDDATGEMTYHDRDGKPMNAQEAERALTAQSREPDVEATAAFEVADPEALARVVTKLKSQGVEPKPFPGVEGAQLVTDGVAVVGGDTIVAVLGDGTRGTEEILAERVRGAADGPPLPEADDSLLATRWSPRALGVWLDQQELDRALGTEIGKAVNEASASIDLEPDGARAQARVDFDGLDEGQLPIGGPGKLALPTGEAIASAASDQQRTTVFLATLARALYPESRFVERVEAYEQKAGVRFEDEVLRAFSGPSATILRVDGEGETAFAARSSLRDPARMRALLPDLAPALPGILEGLQGLGATGLSALLFVAPDAPLTPAAFAILAAVKVSPIATTGGDEQLYEVRGLDPGNRQPLPDGLVYGVIGDVFVVGSTRELANHAATMPTEPADDAGARMRVDVGKLARLLAGSLEDEELLAKLVGSVDLDISAQDGDVVAHGRAQLGG